MEAKNVIQNNVFNGIVWDGQAIEAINTVAKALLNLTEVFKSQNVNIKLLNVEAEVKAEG